MEAGDLQAHAGLEVFFWLCKVVPGLPGPEGGAMSPPTTAPPKEWVPWNVGDPWSPPSLTPPRLLRQEVICGGCSGSKGVQSTNCGGKWALVGKSKQVT